MEFGFSPNFFGLKCRLMMIFFFFFFKVMEDCMDREIINIFNDYKKKIDDLWRFL